MSDFGNIYDAYETAIKLLDAKRYAHAAEYFWWAELFFNHGEFPMYSSEIQKMAIDAHRRRQKIERNMETFSLSKTSYVNGCQCPKYLWLYYNKRKALIITPETQSKFDRGHKVGSLAQRLFPDGNSAEFSPSFSCEILQQKTPFEVPKIPYKITFNIWLDNTRNMLATNGNKSIFEAAFVFDKCFAAIDILEEKNGEYIAYEVKSISEATDVVMADCAYQYYVISHHVKLSGFNLVLLNPEIKDIMLNDDVDVHKLFVIKPILNDILDMQTTTARKIGDLKNVLKTRKCPSMVCGEQCDNPYECGFKDYCSGNYLFDNDFF